MIPLFRLPLLGFLLAFLCASALADTVPDPATKKDVPPIAFVQARIYTQLNLANFTLTGVVRSDKTHKSYPITIKTNKHTIEYEFTDQPLQLRVQLNPGAFTLDRRTSSSGTWSTVPSTDYAKPILGTDMTYGDLAIDFVNWDDITPLGTDTIKTLDAYVFDAHPGPSDHSAFPHYPLLGQQAVLGLFAH